MDHLDSDSILLVLRWDKIHPIHDCLRQQNRNLTRNDGCIFVHTNRILVIPHLWIGDYFVECVLCALWNIDLVKTISYQTFSIHNNIRVKRGKKRNLRGYSERLCTFIVRPFGFSGPVMVQHISMGDQSGCSSSINLQAKVSRTDAHSCPFEFLQCTNLS